MGDDDAYERLKTLGYGSAMRSSFSLEDEYIQLNHGSVSVLIISAGRVLICDRHLASKKC